MTKREEFVARHRHQLAGIVADAFVTPRQGGELSLAIRSAFQKIDRILAEIHDELSPPEPPSPARGVQNNGLGRA